MSSLLALLCSLAHAAAPVPPFPVEANDLTLAAGGKGTLGVHLTIPEGFHIFREMIAVTVVEPAGLTPGAPVMPPGEIVPDPVDPSQLREQYETFLDLGVPLAAPANVAGKKVVKVKVRYQACRDNVCLLPADVYADAVVSVTTRAGALAPGLLPLALVGSARAEDPAEEIPVLFTAGPARPDHVVVHVDLQGDWHLNKLFVSAALPEATDLTLGEPLFPPAHPSGKVEDGTFREDFVEDFDLVVPVTGPPGAREVQAEVAYQACKGVSLCKMPTSARVKVPLELTGAPLPPPPVAVAPADATPPAAAAVVEAPVAASVTPAASPGSFAAAREQGLLALFTLVFLAGIGVSFTPCVLPMVPITMGMIGARSAGSRAGAVALTSAYVLGLAIVYTGLGVFAGVTGALFGSWLQSPLVTGAIAVFFFVMGAAMFGFFDLGVPSFIANRIQGGGTQGGFVGAFVVGMIGAVVAGPCSGPVVVAILALIGQGGQVALGAGLMFTFSVGMGMIFFVTGLASGWLPSRGPWMVVVKKAFGIVMWLGAVYYAAPHLPLTATALLTAGVLLFTAVFAWPHADDGEGWFLERLRQLYAIGGGLVGAYLLVGTLVQQGFILPPVQLGAAGADTRSAGPGIVWLSDEAAAVAQARASGKPMIIDFTAEWCAACHEMEKLTYTDPKVVAAAGDFVTVMIDCTSKADPAVRAIQEKYGVLGLPTVVFVAPDGTQVDRTIGFVAAEEFLPRMLTVAGKG